MGFDANWEGGLEIAKVRWQSHPEYEFFQASTPEEMEIPPGMVFNIAVAMETLEHVPPQLVDGFLAKIARHLDGYFFVTVPNEKGLLFLAKWLTKRVLSKDAQPYTVAELVNATLGRMKAVERRDHKGFDYARLASQIGNHFDVVEISGHPFGFLPTSLCFGIGILAKSRTDRGPGDDGAGQHQRRAH